jgi:hypothetical protein
MKQQVEKKISELKIKQSILVEKNIKGVISDLVLKEQLAIIEAELIKIFPLQQPITLDIKKIHESIEHVLHYLRTPSKLWDQAPFDLKLRLQWFNFPKGIYFDGNECRTIETCSLFKLKNDFCSLLSTKVTLRSEISNQSTENLSQLQDSSGRISSISEESDELFWNKLATEIVAMADMVADIETPAITNKNDIDQNENISPLSTKS